MDSVQRFNISEQRPRSPRARRVCGLYYIITRLSSALLDWTASAFSLFQVYHSSSLLLEARTRHSFFVLRKRNTLSPLHFDTVSFTPKRPSINYLPKSSFKTHHFSSLDDTTSRIMNVRKIIESYEQEKSSTVARTVTLRPRSRPRPRTQPDASPGTPYQRSLRTQRQSNLKIVQEERPVTIVLKVRWPSRYKTLR